MQDSLSSTAPLGGRGTLSVTDGVVPPKSLRLQAIPEFLLKMYTRSRNVFFFILGPCLRKISRRWQRGSPKIHDNMVNFYCLVAILIVKYELI